MRQLARLAQPITGTRKNTFQLVRTRRPILLERHTFIWNGEKYRGPQKERQLGLVVPSINGASNVFSATVASPNGFVYNAKRIFLMPTLFFTQC